MNTALYINSSAGNFSNDLIAKINDVFIENDQNIPDVYILDKTINSDNDANKATNYDRVIVAGGDGTLKNFAEKLIETNIPMGIIPIGTANCLARELNIPLNPIKAANLIFNNKTANIDVGIANERVFLTMASAGIDAETVKEVSPVAKQIIGGAAYVLEGIGSLITYKPTNIRIIIDGEVLETKSYLVIVTNTSKYGSGVNLAPQADIMDGILDVCIFQKPMLDNFGFLLQIAKVISSVKINDKDIIYKKGKEIVLESDPEIPTQIDGDTLGYTKLEVKSLQQVLKVYIP